MQGRIGRCSRLGFVRWRVEVRTLETLVLPTQEPAYHFGSAKLTWLMSSSIKLPHRTASEALPLLYSHCILADSNGWGELILSLKHSVLELDIFYDADYKLQVRRFSTLS